MSTSSFQMTMFFQLDFQLGGKKQKEVYLDDLNLEFLGAAAYRAPYRAILSLGGAKILKEGPRSRSEDDLQPHGRRARLNGFTA